ncbi:MAG: MoxR family ATPase [Thermoproteota archaeon]|nr:MoxR family ATPase [Candidatus Brockarchaeota archaeon]
MSYSKYLTGKILTELQKYIVGKQEVIEMLLTALFSEGHVLLEGPPGTAKTLMAKTFAQAIGAKFARIQMTPDTLPADILGTMVYSMRDSAFQLKKGPIFSNIILVDELNRAPPKTQAAFIEVMQELQVTIEGNTFPVEKPFMIIATQMPYGSPGTYPLTEVQTDRFAFKIRVSNPTPEEEKQILEKINFIETGQVGQVATKTEVLSMVERARNIYVSDAVKKYIVDLVSSLRNNHSLSEGPSVRASIWLLKASRSHALVKGREYVIPDDVKAVAPHVLRHRLLLKKEPLEEVDEDQLIAEALASTPVPKR